MTVGQLRAPLAVAIEALWCYAAAALFVAVLGTGDGPAPSLVAVAAAAFGSFGIARFLQRTDVDERSMRKIGVAISVLAVALIAHFEYDAGSWLWSFEWLRALVSDPGGTAATHGHVIAGIMALSVIWLRGLARGQTDIEPEDVLASASIGLLVLAIAAMAAPDARWPGSFGVLAIAFALLALLTLATFRAPDAEIPVTAFAARWLPGIAAVAGAATVIVLVALAIDPDAFGFLSPLHGPLAAVGNFVGTYVLGPIFGLVALPFRLFGWLFNQLFGGSKHEDPQQPAQPPLPTKNEHKDTPLWAQVVGAVLGGGAALALIIGMLVFAWYAFRRYGRREKDARERRESVEAASTLGDDVAALFGALRARFARRERRTPAAPVQRLYFEMLERAEQRGIERPASATPMQFAPALDAHFVSDAPTAISEAFDESRYGERDVDEVRVRELRERWGRGNAKPSDAR